MTDELSFVRTEEQELLAKTAQRFLADRVPLERVRRDMTTDAGYAPDLWAEVAALGWPAMAVPERHGGAGYGFEELAALFEETGRTLFPGPLLGSAVLATTALLHGGTDAQQQELLPLLAAGEVTATVAVGHAERPDSPALIGTSAAGGIRLDGELPLVVDGHTADHLIVPARVCGATELYLVAGDTPGVTRRAQPTLDQTRRLATVTCEGVEVDDDARLAGDGAAVLAAVRTAGVIALACEQVGGARQVLEMATAYARSRKQFGRAIGSFQAVKHRLADMLVEVETARSAAYHAARALAAGDDDEVAVAAPLAASHCAEAYERVAADALQVHGGIGFTWEHDVHLYLKRAKASKLMFGSPSVYRRALADTLGL